MQSHPTIWITWASGDFGRIPTECRIQNVTVSSNKWNCSFLQHAALHDSCSSTSHLFHIVPFHSTSIRALEDVCPSLSLSFSPSISQSPTPTIAQTDTHALSLQCPPQRIALHCITSYLSHFFLGLQDADALSAVVLEGLATGEVSFHLVWCYLLWSRVILFPLFDTSYLWNLLTSTHTNANYVLSPTFSPVWLQQILVTSLSAFHLPKLKAPTYVPTSTSLLHDSILPLLLSSPFGIARFHFIELLCSSYLYLSLLCRILDRLKCWRSTRRGDTTIISLWWASLTPWTPSSPSERHHMCTRPPPPPLLPLPHWLLLS